MSFITVKTIRRYLALFFVTTPALAQLFIPTVFADPIPPQYQPFYLQSFDHAITDNAFSNFEISTTPERKVYSKELSGPFGGTNGRVIKQTIEALKKGFGGRIASTDLGENAEIWVRWYEYFPADFIFANGTKGSEGAAGALKWVRFQYPGHSERITVLLDSASSCAAPCARGLQSVSPDSIQGEGLNWKARYGNVGIRISSDSFPLGQWHAMQVYLRLSKGSADKGDGSGLIRMWINDSLVGEYQHSTLPSNGGHLQSIWWGNYWNGGSPITQHWYFDEVIITSQTPSTQDANGHFYIHPNTQVAHFSEAPIPSPPSPPTNLQVELQ